MAVRRVDEALRPALWLRSSLGAALGRRDAAFELQDHNLEKPMEPNRPSGVVGGTPSIDPDAGLRKTTGPSAVDDVMANRKIAAVRAEKAQERIDAAARPAKTKKRSR